jgi:hypothetical protein
VPSRPLTHRADTPADNIKKKVEELYISALGDEWLTSDGAIALGRATQRAKDWFLPASEEIKVRGSSSSGAMPPWCTR